MPDQENWKQRVEPRIADQVDYILTKFHDAGADIGLVTSDRGVGFMYAEGQLLVRDGYLERVQRLLARHFDLGSVEHVVDGVVLLPIEPKPSGDALPEPAGVYQPKPVRHRRLTVIHALELISAEVGDDAATPDHVLTVAPVVGPCPATEPQEVYDGIEPYPGICTENSGAGVLVYVADTGLLKDADSTHPWMRGVRPAREPDGSVDWDLLGPAGAGGTPVIPAYVGHGTFVAGVVRCMAPRADVIVANIFRIAGSVFESDLVKDLDRALKLGVDVFNLSIAAPTWKDLRLLGFGGWLRRLRQYKGVACVVAAGNDGGRMPCWPGAFPGVVSVGALAGDWRNRASFSNYGGWVDVYAPGRDLINAYARGTYICEVAPYRGRPRHFYGMAKWSGTSFSTPIVTGLIADRMSRKGEDGQEAAQALLRQARSRAIPGVGAVLLPCGRRDDEWDGCARRCGHCCRS